MTNLTIKHPPKCPWMGGGGEAKGATENVHSFVTSLCGGLPQDNSDPEHFLFIKNVKLRGAGQEKRFFWKAYAG